jgi:transcriptional regulator with PAS, ATPase and Fis domain
VLQKLQEIVHSNVVTQQDIECIDEASGRVLLVKAVPLTETNALWTGDSTHDTNNSRDTNANNGNDRGTDPVISRTNHDKQRTEHSGATITGFVLTFIDVTAVKQKEAVEQHLVSEMWALYDTGPWGLALLDRTGRYLRCNSTLARMNGIPPEQHVGKSILDVSVLLYKLTCLLTRHHIQVVPQEIASIELQLLNQVFQTKTPIVDYELLAESLHLPGMVCGYEECGFGWHDSYFWFHRQHSSCAFEFVPSFHNCW